MLRCSGGRVRACEETIRSPTWISPSVGSRNPAISRNVVVLPQPEGPNRQINRPWSIRNETLSTTASDPNRLVRPRNSTDANHFTPCCFLARTNAGGPKSLDGRSGGHTFSEIIDGRLDAASAVRDAERVEADFDDAQRAEDHRRVDVAHMGDPGRLACEFADPDAEHDAAF